MTKLNINRDYVALDASTLRRTDENGFLHVSVSHISKEAVNPYYGREIPGWEDFGLEPDKIYQGYRAGAELKKAASTFNGLPLLLDHHVDSAEDPQKDHRIGSLGTDAAFNAPYLDNSLIFTDAAAIAAIESGECRELSSSYRYDPVFAAGAFNGEQYDFVMTNIRGNHVALVEEGRAGPDVVVADANNINPKPTRTKLMGLIQKIKELLKEAEAEGLTPEAGGGEPAAVGGDNEDVTPAEEPAEDDDPGTQLLALVDAIPDPELKGKIKTLIDQMRGGAPAGDEDVVAEKTEPAKDEDPAPAEEKPEPAKDKKPGKPATPALDAAAVKADMARHFRALSDAAREVRPLIGDVDPLAFDSAADIYKKALALSGHKPGQYPATAWRGMCEMLKKAKAQTDYPVMSAALAGDSKELDPNFAHLGNIRNG